MSDNIHLFDYWRSSASYRVRIALGLAGLSWNSTPINLVEGEQRSPLHLGRNPQGLVPVLKIDDLSLTQSLAIIEYLNETRKMDLLPNNAEDKARVRALTYAIAMEIHPVCNLRVAKYAVQTSDGTMTTEQWMQHFIHNGLSDFEQMLSGGDFCFGDNVTLADICLVPQVYNAIRWHLDLADYPKIRQIHENLNRISAFQAAHLDQTPK